MPSFEIHPSLFSRCRDLLNRKYTARGFPGAPGWDTLRPDDPRCRVFEKSSKPLFFFTREDPLDLPDLRFPVVKNLVPLVPADSIPIEPLCGFLRKVIGNRIMILVETCNQPGMDLLFRLNPRKTYYCQKKMILFPGRREERGSATIPGIHIRRFVPGNDEQRYADFYNEALGFLGTRVDRAFVEQIVRRTSFDANGYFIAETEQGDTAGFLSIEKEPWGPPESGFGYLFQVGVSKRHRGTGLGIVLMECARNYALARGIDRIGVGVRDTNGRAVRFFLNQGFDPAFDVKGYLLEP